jgi:hypothetical protein
MTELVYRVRIETIDENGNTKELPAPIHWVGPLPRMEEHIRLSATPGRTWTAVVSGITHQVHNFGYEREVVIQLDLHPW